MNAKEKVYKITSLIPKGKVLTYSALARLSGYKNPRVVGNILNKNPDPKKYPCHRVVAKSGKISRSYAFGGAIAQGRKLIREGIKVVNGKVNLDKHLWEPNENELKNISKL
jgi:methylated-DNA-protein-cysteine methyltransferase-like protein